MTDNIEGNAQCTHKPRWKVFGFAFFKKRIGSQGDALRRTPQSAKYLHRSKNAGEGEFLCEAKKEGEPSSGVLPYLWLVCIKTKREDNILPYIIFTISANIVR